MSIVDRKKQSAAEIQLQEKILKEKNCPKI